MYILPPFVIKEPIYIAALFFEFKPRPIFREVPPELVEPARKLDAATGLFQLRGAILWNSRPLSLHYL